MPNALSSCEECHRRKQKCNRQTPCQHCIARGKQDICHPHEQPARPKDLIEERLTAVEKELKKHKVLFEHLKRGDRQLARIVDEQIEMAEGVVMGDDDERRDQDETVHDEESHSSERQVLSSFLIRPEVLGEEMERRQVDSILEDLRKTQSVDIQHSPQLGAPPLFNQEQISEQALRNHGVPRTCLADLLSVLPPQPMCETLVSHFYKDINWIRQPWPRSSLCQSFLAFWTSGPVVTTKNINTFALLCSLCAIARLSIKHDDFASDDDTRNDDTRKLQARQLHFTARHALMLSSVFNREDLDQVIAWTLACRFLVLERRYGEAYTCAARTVKAAYSIRLHRDGSKLGLNKEVTEARRKVWSAVYYFDRTISMMTGRPFVIIDRFCDVLPPSEVGFVSDIYPLPSTPPLHLLKQGERLPTVYTYCANRHAIAQLQGRMVAFYLSVQHQSTHLRDKEIASIDQDLHKIKSRLPSYLQANLSQDDVNPGSKLLCDKSLDTYYGFLPIQRFLLQSEMSALCIGLHRPVLLSNENNDTGSVGKCLDAALLDVALYKDFMKHHGSSTQLELQVYIGSHRWFHSILICGIILLAHPRLGESMKLLDLLHDFVDKERRKAFDQAELEASSMKEIEIVNIFIQGFEHRQRTQTNSSDRRKRKNRMQRDAPKKLRRELPSPPRDDDNTSPHLSLGRQPIQDSIRPQELLSAWFTRNMNPSARANDTNSNAIMTDFSQVFGGSQMSSENSASLNHFDMIQQDNVASTQATDWFAEVPIDTLFQHPPFFTGPSFQDDSLYDYMALDDSDSTDVDFWLNLIQKL